MNRAIRQTCAGLVVAAEQQEIIQTELADMAGVSISTVKRVWASASGSRDVFDIRLGVLLRLLGALDVNASRVLPTPQECRAAAK